MVDFFDNYIGLSTKDSYGDDLPNDNSITISVLKSVLPIIIENELTTRQKDCLKLHYYKNLSQDEIAKELHLSQPTVCKHLKSGKSAVNESLKYCMIALCKAEREFDKLM